MTRAQRSWVWYAIALLIGVAIAFVLMWALELRGTSLIILGLVLLIPRRVIRYFWSDFFRGQQQLQLGEYQAATESFSAFLTQLRAKPWLKRLLYAQWSLETWDAEAMTLNNLGVAEMCRGDIESATRHLEEAVRVDSQYGLPYTSLAMLRSAVGDDAGAERLLTQADALGCRPWPRETLREKGAELRAAWTASTTLEGDQNTDGRTV